MKKIILMLTLSLAIFSCKNPEEKINDTDQNNTTEETAKAENVKSYKGDYIDSNGALVLMGTDFIYGVKRNDVSEQLSKRVASVKQNDYDMVNVVVRGVVSKNQDKESEWEEIITINEIVRVSDAPSEADIKFEESAKNK